MKPGPAVKAAARALLLDKAAAALGEAPPELKETVRVRLVQLSEAAAEVLEQAVAQATARLHLPAEFPPPDAEGGAEEAEEPEPVEPLDEALVDTVAALDAHVDELASRVRQMRETMPRRALEAARGALESDAADARLRWLGSARVQGVLAELARAESQARAPTAQVARARRRDKLAEDARRAQVRLETLSAKLVTTADAAEATVSAAREAQAASQSVRRRLQAREGGVPGAGAGVGAARAEEPPDVAAARRVTESLRRAEQDVRKRARVGSEPNEG